MCQCVDVRTIERVDNCGFFLPTIVGELALTIFGVFCEIREKSPQLQTTHDCLCAD